VDWLFFVQIIAVGLAVWAAWLSLPRAPTLDWERLFKVTISVGVWSAEENTETSSSQDLLGVESRWRSVLHQCVPYHPAGRSWLEKLQSPADYTTPIPAISGERALLESLAGLTTVEQRWDRLFGSQAHAVDAGVVQALGDPRDLGESYDPRRILGPDADWEAVAAWSESVTAGLARRLAHVVLLDLGTQAERSLAAVMPGVRHHSVDSTAGVPADGGLSLCTSTSDRLVVCLPGPMLRDWLSQMTRSPTLVDRVILILVVGGRPAVDQDSRNELQSLLSSEALLPELQRQTPIVVVDDVNPDDPLQSGMAPITLAISDPSRVGVRWVDLGPLPVDRVPAAPLTRALALTMVFLLEG
jgi:hypothetical protein